MKGVALITACIGGLLFAGCAQENESTDTTEAKVDGSKYLLESEPKDAAGVKRARKESKDKDDVVIVGRIGGDVNPWFKDRAAFRIVDTSLKSCTEVGSHGCAHPWDFC